jgi:hypothetical integral membrane protein (TIGR02206 family)
MCGGGARREPVRPVAPLPTWSHRGDSCRSCLALSAGRYCAKAHEVDASVLACLTNTPAVVEFAWFAGLAGAGMALLTPNLISPWPSYPAIYFFVAHGGIVILMAALVLGGEMKFRRVAVWRSFGLLLVYAGLVGLIDWASGSNFMFLAHKPEATSALDQMGPWPWYLLAGAAAGLLLFWLLWLPVRAQEQV